MKTIEFEKQLITPSFAKKLLEQNVNNRRISQPILLRYVSDMVNGKWKEDTGELIKISKTGRVLDGQHRLQAVIKANCSIFFHIAYNINDEVFDVLDSGKLRNATDCFKISDIKHENIIPSTIAHFKLLQDGKRKGQQANFKLTNAELLKTYYDDEQFWQEVARLSVNWYKAFAKVLPPSWIGGFYAHFYKLNSEKADEFMNQLCTGMDISNITINLLRTKLMQDRMSLRKMHQNMKMALIIKTWNHFINNIQLTVIKYNTIQEKFPIAIKSKQ